MSELNKLRKGTGFKLGSCRREFSEMVLVAFFFAACVPTVSVLAATREIPNPKRLARIGTPARSAWKERRSSGDWEPAQCASVTKCRPRLCYIRKEQAVMDLYAGQALS